MKTSQLFAAAALALAVTSGCGAGDESPDASADATETDIADAGGDVAVDSDTDDDAGSDADTDAPADVPTPDVAHDVDTSPDVLPDADAAPDADVNAAPDADVDAAPDADVDATPDVSPDADVDAAPDADVDATPDVFPDADVDATPDVLPDVDAAADADATETSFAVHGTYRRAAGEFVPADGSVWLTLSVDGDVAEELRVGAMGAFAFSTELEAGAAFAVTVTGQPLDMYCDVNDAEGTVADVDPSVDVVCVEAQSIMVERFATMEVLLGERADVLVTEDTVELRWLWFEHAEVTRPVWPDDPDYSGGRIERLTRGGVRRLTVWTNGFGPDGLADTDDDYDDVASYFEATVNEQGEVILEAEYGAAGDDTEWFTEDDVANNQTRTLRTYDEDGRPSCTALIGAGDDAEFDTPDDWMDPPRWTTYAELEVFDMSGVHSHFATAGDDELPCTGDDELGEPSSMYQSADGLRTIYTEGGSDYVEERIDGAGALVERVTWTMAAPPTIGGPGVDTILEITFSSGVPTGDDWREFIATDPGPDAAWRTADDVFTSSMPLTIRDDEGRVVRRIEYPVGPEDSLTGPDGLWGTDDDLVERDALTQFGADSTCTVYRQARGANGVWDDTDCGNGVVDDDIVVRWSHTDASTGNVRVCQSLDPGDDDVWANDDDGIGEFAWLYAPGPCTIYEYPAPNTEVSYALQPGDDDTYFTGDDTHSRVSLFETNDDGNEVLWVEFPEPEATADELAGPDGEWLTGDDVIDSYTMNDFDRAGNLVRSRTWWFPGVDELWYTDDDDIQTDETWTLIPGIGYGED